MIDDIALITPIRLACLVHDIAKPWTAIMKEGRLQFPRYGSVGVGVVVERFTTLGFQESQVDFLSRMVRQHLRPAELVRNRPPSDEAVAEFVAAVDGHVLPLTLVNLADGAATRGPRYTRENFRIHCSLVNYVVGGGLCDNSESA